MLDKALKILQEYYGYSQFKPGQKEIIEKIMEGQDVLGIMPKVQVNPCASKFPHWPWGGLQ